MPVPGNPEHWYGIADPVSAEPYPTAPAYAEVATTLSEKGAPAGDAC